MPDRRCYVRDCPRKVTGYVGHQWTCLLHLVDLWPWRQARGADDAR